MIFAAKKHPGSRRIIISVLSLGYPLVMTNSLLWKMALEIADLPIENCDFPYLMLNYRRGSPLIFPPFSQVESFVETIPTIVGPRKELARCIGQRCSAIPPTAVGGLAGTWHGEVGKRIRMMYGICIYIYMYIYIYDIWWLNVIDWLLDWLIDLLLLKCIDTADIPAARALHPKGTSQYPLSSGFV